MTGKKRRARGAPPCLRPWCLPAFQALRKIVVWVGAALSRLRSLPPNNCALDLFARLLFGEAQLVELLQIEPHLC